MMLANSYCIEISIIVVNFEPPSSTTRIAEDGRTPACGSGVNDKSLDRVREGVIAVCDRGRASGLDAVWKHKICLAYSLNLHQLYETLQSRILLALFSNQHICHSELLRESTASTLINKLSQLFFIFNLLQLKPK